MSIGLFITYQDPAKEDRLIPIASDETFHKYWQPMCRSLQLRWISRFESGWTLSALDLPPMLEELRRLRQVLPQSEIPAEALHHLLARISVLRRELSEIQRMPTATAYVGCLLQTRGSSRRRTRTVAVKPSVQTPRPTAGDLMPPGAQAAPVLNNFLEATKAPPVPNTPDFPLPGRTASVEPLELPAIFTFPAFWNTAFED